MDDQTPYVLLEICRSEFWHKEIILSFRSDARQMSSSLDNDSTHLLIQSGMCEDLRLKSGIDLLSVLSFLF